MGRVDRFSASGSPSVTPLESGEQDESGGRERGQSQNKQDEHLQDVGAV